MLTELRYVYVKITPPTSSVGQKTVHVDQTNTWPLSKNLGGEKNKIRTGLKSSCEDASKHARGVTQTRRSSGPWQSSVQHVSA